VRWNRKAEAVTGWTAEELRGRHVLTFSDDDGRIALGAAFARALAGQATEADYQLPTKEGDVVPHLVSARRVEVAGRPWVIGVSIDVSARRAAEEQARRHHVELVRVGRVAAMGALGAAIAHEVSQPLAAIRVNAQAFRRLLARGPLPPGELDEGLTDIAADALRANVVIARLRALARRDDSERLLLDPNAVVAEVEPLLRLEVRTRGVPLVVALASELPPIHVDRVQIQQVILNLVRNAAEALRGHEGAIEVRTAVGATGMVELTVRDAGPPIDDAVFARLFEQFHTTKTDGLGIGLWLSRAIVEAHGGHLRAVRNAGWGLTLHVTVPAAVPGAA
jgi:PAS domain S-box-containing protein